MSKATTVPFSSPVRNVVCAESGAEASTPACVVGAGRIGLALAGMDPGNTYVVKRGQQIPADIDGPIYVCTRNDDLDQVLSQCPKSRWKDLVFMQNGFIEPWLEKKGLQNNTQALIYFAVSFKGDEPVDGGRTVAWGYWAEELMKRLSKGGIKCTVLTDREEFRRRMVEKWLWICVMGIICARYAKNVGDATEAHIVEIEELTMELAGIAEKHLGLRLKPGVVARLCEYSKSVPDFNASVKEFDWRHKWFIDKERTPLHVGYLQQLGFVDTSFVLS